MTNSVQNPLENSLWQSKAYVRTWQVVLGLFALSILTSKSGLQIFGALLTLIAIAGMNWKVFFSQEKPAVAVFLLYPLAILCGLFSLGHGASALHVAVAWPWLLFVLPTILVMKRPLDLKIAKYCLMLGLALACLKCFYLFGTEFHWDFDAKTRVRSFWDVSRWGLFSGLIVILLIAGLVNLGAKKIFSSWFGIVLFLLTIADLACLLLSNSRGPWLAAGVALALFLFLYPKIWKMILPVAIVGSLAFLFSKNLNSRLFSIGEVQSEQGVMTSKDQSNRGRLSMWKVALDFYKEQPLFGTGFENAEVPLRNFLSHQSDSYRQKYTTVEYSYSDQHSSPLSILTQMGVLFSVVFWLVIGFCISVISRRWYRSRSLLDATLLAGIVFQLVLCLFYTSFLSYEIVSFIPLLIFRQKDER